MLGAHLSLSHEVTCQLTGVAHGVANQVLGQGPPLRLRPTKLFTVKCWIWSSLSLFLYIYLNFTQKNPRLISASFWHQTLQQPSPRTADRNSSGEIIIHELLAVVLTTILLQRNSPSTHTTPHQGFTVLSFGTQQALLCLLCCRGGKRSQRSAWILIVQKLYTSRFTERSRFLRLSSSWRRERSSQERCVSCNLKKTH